MKISTYISTLFGVGYFPKAPGTAGTIVAASVYWLLPANLFESFPANLFFLISVFGVSFFSVTFISQAEKELGHDSSKIVLDEFWGFLIAVAFLPKLPIVLIAGFVLFRFFDIVKPEPVNILEKLPRGWGVIADDLMAGIYTNLAMRIFLISLKIK